MRKSRTRRHGQRESRAALGIVERLESRQLLSISPGAVISAAGADDASAAGGCPICGTGCCRHTTAAGLEYMACRLPAAEMAALATPSTPASLVAPLTETFRLHSLPGATKKIYLDFDGHLTTNTAWGQTIDTPAYSLDNDFTTFSDWERTVIQDIWARVAEDFIPFDVDVTTEAVPVEDLRNTGGADTRWGMRVVIGGDGAWMPGAAGVAFVGSFNWNSDTPCFAFAGQGWKANAEFAATCISHEVGHTLGLRHDGYGTQEYYGGRGTGVNSWGPLMGNPSRPLTQWSNGDYGQSTNRQDDLTVMTGYGFGFRPDDHGDSIANATIATSADVTVAGIVGRRTDIDVIGFDALAGELLVAVKPLGSGVANLDVLARLMDSAGKVIATSNPATALDASFRVTVAAGRYFVAVDGTGFGDPNTTGYSDYGSLGQYTVTVGKPDGNLPTLSVADVTVTEGNTGTTQATLTFTLAAPPTAPVTVDYRTADGTATTADGDYTAANGTVTFAVGETQKTVTVTVRGDTRVESNELFAVNLSSPVNAILARPSALVTITNDDGGGGGGGGGGGTTPPSLAVSDVTVVEGNSGTTRATLTFTLSAAARSTVTVRYATADGTAKTSDADYVAASGVVTFAAGETRKTITVTVNGDAKVETTESFSVALSNAVGATLPRSSAWVTITNDDAAVAAPTVTISGPATVAEGNSGTKSVAFEVALSRPVAETTAVTIALVAGTATAGIDFRGPTETTLVFSPLRQTIRVLVAIVGDRAVEADETFRLVLSNPVGVQLGAVTDKTVTITNDDAAGVVAGSRAGQQAGVSASVAGFMMLAQESGASQKASSVRVSRPAAVEIPRS